MGTLVSREVVQHNDTYREGRIWYRNSKPWISASPFDMYRYSSSGTLSRQTHAYAFANGSYSPTGLKCADCNVAASNKALERFKNQLLDNASLGAAFAERASSIDMIAKRAIQIRQAFSAVRKGNIGAARKHLGIPGGSGKNNVPKPSSKDAANWWLELHFGWTPLIGDIYSSVDVLQQEFKLAPVRGRATESAFENRLVLQDTSTKLITLRYNYLVKYQVSGEMVITNPNLLLANQLGLINPAGIAWELVPFSFVVDWFLPVGDFLNSFTDQVGYSLKNPFTTYSRTVTSTWTQRESYPHGTFYTTHQGTAYLQKRYLGHPPYQLRFSRLKAPSVTRAATAIALLRQIFL